MKRFACVLLAAALLWAAALLPAYADPAPAANPRTADVSAYPTITLAGGSHQLYYDENGPGRREIYNPDLTGSIISEYITPLISALLKADYDGMVDILKEALTRIYGEAAMDENGDSLTENVTSDLHTFAGWNLDGSRVFYSFDFRLSPMENAEKLHEFVGFLKERRGMDKFNFIATSASGSIMLAYMKLYGYDAIASLVMNISLHNGISLFEALGTGKISIGAEALGKAKFDISGLNLPIELQPWLRILYETGLFDVISKISAVGMRPWLDRVYDEILIPLIFMMPVYWTYIPVESFEEAKEFLLKGDDKYEELVKKIDRYHYEVGIHSEEILLEASEKTKLSVRVGYGKPSMPLGESVNVQGDGMVEAFRAGLGATGSPIDEPFLFCYEQEIDDGHDHISPDRYIDASTCLLPEQTWFSYMMTHTFELSYSGWHEWWLATDEPTVFGNEAEFPQFSEMTEPGVFVPRVVEEISPVVDLLKAIGLWLLKAWRWVVTAPLFWLKWL